MLKRKFNTAKSFILRNRFWVLVFMATLFFSLLVPFDGDDFTFLAYSKSVTSLPDYIHGITQMYDNLNGRLFGNGMLLAFVMSPILFSIVRAMIMTAIAYVVVKIISPKTLTMKTIVVLMTFLVPAHIFSQTYGWHAGFFNYVTSSVGILLLIYLMKRIFLNDRPIAFWKLGFASLSLIIFSLFAENVTVVMLLGVLASAMFALVVHGLRSDKFKGTLVLLVGATLGTLLMFSSPGYGQVASGSDEYRSINVTAAEVSAVEQYSDKMYRMVMGVFGPESFLILISAIIIICIAIYSSRSLTGKKRTTAATILLAMSSIYPLFMLSQAGGDVAYQVPPHLQVYVKLGVVLYTIVFIIGLVYSGWAIRGKKWGLVSAVLLIVAASLMGPFLFIEPFGGRNFLSTYLIVLIVVLIPVIHEFEKNKKLDSRAIGYVNTITVSVIIFIMAAFSFIKYIELQNARTIESAQDENSTIYLRKYPFGRLVRNNNDPIKLEGYKNVCMCPYSVACGVNCSYKFKIEFAE